MMMTVLDLSRILAGPLKSGASATRTWAAAYGYGGQTQEWRHQQAGV